MLFQHSRRKNQFRSDAPVQVLYLKPRFYLEKAKAIFLWPLATHSFLQYLQWLWSNVLNVCKGKAIQAVCTHCWFDQSSVGKEAGRCLRWPTGETGGKLSEVIKVIPL